ncbi:hypothetical protein ABT039_09475 [Streptomyces lasiicapitis]|uniref:hypothetical protein n=1 Tax=Streptomyces lasiicapitis TaxID=1923961 RepID=UPI0033342A77
MLEPWLRRAARWGDEDVMRQDAARTGTAPPSFDWCAEAAAWAASPPDTSADPKGDVVAAARAVLRAVESW